MIGQQDIDRVERVADDLRHALVLLAREGHARRMVVCEYDGRRIASSAALTTLRTEMPAELTSPLCTRIQSSALHFASRHSR